MVSNMTTASTILALATCILARAVPDVAAAPPSFSIKSVVSGGSGCPQGSVDVDHTDSSILPIRFGSDFTASVGPNVDPDQSRKNCQLNIDLDFSPGYQYSVLSVNYNGWGSLDSGVEGVVKANYYMSGQQVGASSSLVLAGPYNGAYSKHDEVEVSAWSPCSSEALLNADVEVALTPMSSTASGTLVATKESARFVHSIYLQWQQC